MPTFRAPMRSRRDDVAEGAAVARALDIGVCGLGGRLPEPPTSLAEALGAVSEAYDERSARRLERFAEAPDGSAVWTRDADGWYWSGTLNGPWRYDPAPEAFAVDLVHVRPCRWQDQPVPDLRVPSAVLETFARGGRNWQRIHAAG